MDATTVELESVGHSRSPHARRVVLESRHRLACVERRVTEVQRSLDLSILERQVTAAADSQECKVTDSNQPFTVIQSLGTGPAAAPSQRQIR